MKEQKRKVRLVTAPKAGVVPAGCITPAPLQYLPSAHYRSYPQGQKVDL